MYLKGWSALDKEGVGLALVMLCDFGYLVADEVSKGRNGGRPKTIYLINPEALNI